MKRMIAAGLALLVLAGPANAQSADQVRDARCAYLKSVILGAYLEDEEPDQQVIAGLISNITYFFGRLEATMERPAIANLIVAEGSKFQTDEQLVEAETVCDAHLEGTTAFMQEVGERLEQASN